MKIRKATPKDALAIKDMIEKLSKEGVSLHSGALKKQTAGWETVKSTAKIKKQMKSKKYIYFVAEKDKKIIGFITGELMRAPRTTEGFVSDIYVYPEYRKQAIGKKLMAEFARWTKSRNCNWMSLMVYTRNKKGKKFYERLGFDDVVEIMKKKI
ncbi:GNAT family N-acetyltransferase [Candidatus Woesearchaeota archaeon]|nr:GNAT family N-acetyltransferase [Candidatus Woesearchaeota archaeon]